MIEDHLSPKKNVIMERFRFNSRNRKEGESVKEYIVELKKLVRDCQYGDKLSEMMRDRLVCGIGDVTIQRKMLMKEDLTYEDAVKIAFGTELTTKQAGEMSTSAAGGQRTQHWTTTSTVDAFPTATSTPLLFNKPRFEISVQPLGTTLCTGIISAQRCPTVPSTQNVLHQPTKRQDRGSVFTIHTACCITHATLQRMSPPMHAPRSAQPLHRSLSPSSTRVFARRE